MSVFLRDLPLVFSLHSSCSPQVITYELVSSVTSIWYHRLLNPGSFTRALTSLPHPDAPWTSLPVSRRHIQHAVSTTTLLASPPCSLSLSHTHIHTALSSACLSFSTPSARSISIHCPNHLRCILKSVLSLDPFLISDKDAPVLPSSFFFLC